MNFVFLSIFAKKFFKGKLRPSAGDWGILKLRAQFQIGISRRKVAEVDSTVTEACVPHQLAVMLPPWRSVTIRTKERPSPDPRISLWLGALSSGLRMQSTAMD